MASHKKNISMFKNLAQTEITALTISGIEKLVCHLFGCKKQKHIRKILALHFQKECHFSKKKGKPLHSIKNLNPKSFPTCQRVLVKQVKRACFVAILYKTARIADPAKNYTEITLHFSIDLFVFEIFYDTSQSKALRIL